MKSITIFKIFKLITINICIPSTQGVYKKEFFFYDNSSFDSAISPKLTPTTPLGAASCVELFRYSRSSLFWRTRPRRCLSTAGDVFPTFPEEPTMDWSFGCLESHSPGSTTLLKTDFLLEKRFDKLSFDSGEEDLISSRLAGKTSIARPTEWSLMGTWRIPMSLCVSPSGDAEISFSGAKSALLSLNCWGERNLFIRWASFFVDSFSPIPTKREFAGEEAFIWDASLNTSALASSLMPS